MFDRLAFFYLGLALTAVVIGYIANHHIWGQVELNQLHETWASLPNGCLSTICLLIILADNDRFDLGNILVPHNAELVFQQPRNVL